MSTQFVLSARRNADGHESAIVRMARFADANEFQPGCLKTIGFGRKRGLGRRREGHGVCTTRDRFIGAFAGRVNDLCCLDSPRQVRANDDVMRQR